MHCENAGLGAVGRHVPSAQYERDTRALGDGNLNVVVVDAVVIAGATRVRAVQLDRVANELLWQSYCRV